MLRENEENKRSSNKKRRDLNGRPSREQEKERTANRIRILNDLKNEEEEEEVEEEEENKEEEEKEIVKTSSRKSLLFFLLLFLYYVYIHSYVASTMAYLCVFTLWRCWRSSSPFISPFSLLVVSLFPTHDGRKTHQKLLNKSKTTTFVVAVCLLLSSSFSAVTHSSQTNGSVSPSSSSSSVSRQRVITGALPEE